MELLIVAHVENWVSLIRITFERNSVKLFYSILGTSEQHVELERLTAKFLNVEDAIVFGMGFATNALNLPTLLSPGCLVVSDEKNHASIILGQ